MIATNFCRKGIFKHSSFWPLFSSHLNGVPSALTSTTSQVFLNFYKGKAPFPSRDSLTTPPAPLLFQTLPVRSTGSAQLTADKARKGGKLVDVEELRWGLGRGQATNKVSWDSSAALPGSEETVNPKALLLPGSAYLSGYGKALAHPLKSRCHTSFGWPLSYI